MKNLVACIKLNKERSIQEDIKKVIGLIGGIESIINKGDRVLIKPNLNSLTGYTTHGIIRKVVELCKNAGAKNITIGESTFGGSKRTGELFDKTGYRRLAQELEIELINFNRGECIELEVPEAKVAKTLKISKRVFEFNKIINIPVAKTHYATQVTLALKNLKGFLFGFEKNRMHNIGLEHAIVDINRLIKPDITILDGIEAMEGFGPHWGNLVDFGILIAGYEPFFVDIIGSYIMGFDPKSIDHLVYTADAFNNGEIDLTKINVVGDSIEAVRKLLLKPPIELEFPEDVEVIEQNACSSCIGSLMLSFDLMKKSGEIEKLKEYTIVLGNKLLIKNDIQKLIIFGGCLSKYKNRGIFIEGCPPLPFKIIEVVGGRIEI